MKEKIAELISKNIEGVDACDTERTQVSALPMGKARAEVSDMW